MESGIVKWLNNEKGMDLSKIQKRDEGILCISQELHKKDSSR